MRVNICSRSLAAFVFLAIVAVSHATVWWVPVWKQTTVLRYHPKKGWYPIKHGGHGSTFLKPKKLPPLSQIVKQAALHYKKAVDTHGPLSHTSVVHNHHPKYRGWRRKKPIHKEVHHIHHHPPPPPPHPPCPSCHSSWNPSKTKNNEPPKSKPKPHRPPPLPSKLKQKRRPRPRPNAVPSFKINFPSPFHLRPIPPTDFLPKPGGPPRPRPRPRGKKIYRQNPFHKVVHFTPSDAKKVKPRPFSRVKGNKHYFKSVRRPIKLLRSPPIPHPHRPKSPKVNTFFSDFNSPADFGLRLNKPDKSPKVPRVKEFLDHEHVGPFNFHNFPKTNNPPKPPVVNTFYSSFGNGDIFKVDNLPKDPKFHDFLAKPGPEPGFSFDTFPKMNNPPPAPKFPNTYFSNNQFGNIFHNEPAKKKPNHSPRVPRIKSMFPLLYRPRPNIKVNKYPKIYDHPRPRPKPLKPYKRHYFPRRHNRPRPPHHDFPLNHDSPGPKPNDDFPHIHDHDHDHDHDHPPKLNDDSKEHDHSHNHHNHHDSDEDAPKSNHLHNSGGHHNYGGFGGTGGFGTSSGFSAGHRGQGWGEWVW